MTRLTSLAVTRLLDYFSLTASIHEFAKRWLVNEIKQCMEREGMPEYIFDFSPPVLLGFFKVCLEQTIWYEKPSLALISMQSCHFMKKFGVEKGMWKLFLCEKFISV